MAVTGALVLAGPTLASPIDDYRRNGTIDPCKYSDGQLKRGLKDLPPDVEQYAPGLADQLNAGRESCGTSGSNPRQTEGVPAPGAPGNGGDGSGGKGGGGKGGGVGSGAVDAAGNLLAIPAPPSPTPAFQRRLAGAGAPRVAARIGGDPPGWILPVLLILLAGAAVVAVVRLTGASAQRVTRPLGAAFTEAGARTSDSMVELWDRVRLGR